MSFAGGMSSEELTFILKMRDEATAILKKHQQELNGVGAAAGAANKPLGDTASKLRGTGQAAKESAAGLNEWIGAAGKAASAAVGFATSVGLLTKSVKDFGELQSGMIGVSKTTGIVGRDLRDLQDSLVSMSTVAPNTTKELTDIAEAAGQLGVSSREGIVAYTDTIAKMGAATNLHGEEAANILAKMQNLMGENTAQVKRLGSAMVALGNDSAASEREIAQMSMSVAQNTANFKIGSANAIGLSAAMVELGATAELGGSAMGRVFMQLDQAVKKGDQNLTLLASITGKTRDEFATLFRSDPTEAVLAFVTAIGKLTKEGANTLPVFQQLNLDQLELMRVLNPLAANYEKITQRVRQSNQAFQENSALDKEAATAYASLQNQLKMAGNAFTALSQSIGAVYAPMVEAAAKLTTDFLVALRTGFDGLSDPLKAFVAYGAAAAGVLGPIALAIRTLAPMLSLLRVGFMGLAALAGGPIGATALAVGAVATAAALVADSTDRATEATKQYAEASKMVTAEGRKLAEEDAKRAKKLSEEAALNERAAASLKRLAELRQAEAAAKQAQNRADSDQKRYDQQLSATARQAGVSPGDLKVLPGTNLDGLRRGLVDAREQTVLLNAALVDLEESPLLKNRLEVFGKNTKVAVGQAAVSMSSLDVALKEAADAVGLVYENGKLMLKSTSDGSAATEKLTAAFKSLDPAAAGAKERLALMDSVLQMIAEKGNPAAAAIARLNSETAALKVPEGLQRDRWKFLFDAADPAQKQGMLAGKDLVDVFGFDQLNELNGAFTRNVQANSDARVATGERELAFDKRMAAARASGVRGAEAAARAKKVYDDEMLRSQNGAEATRLAQIELAKGMADAGAEAALAQREFRLAADAQQRIAEAASQGAAAIHEAELRNQAYAEAVKAGAEGSAGFNKVYAQTLAQLQRADMAQHVTEFAKWTNEQNIAIDAAKRLADAQLLGTKAVQAATVANEIDQKIRTSTVKLTEDEIKTIKEKTEALAEQRAQEAHNAKVKSVKDDIADKKLELSVLGMEETQRSKILYLEKERRRILDEQGSLTEGRGKEQWDLAQQYAQANAELERGTKIWDTIKGAVDDVGQFLLDGLTNVENKGKSVFENMFDAARASAKRFLLNLAIDFAKQTFILPIAASFMGALGIGGSGGGAGGVSSQVQSIAGGSGGGMGGMGNLLSLGSKFVPSSWTSGITSAIDGWGYSALGIGGPASVMPASVLTANAGVGGVGSGMLAGGGATSVIPGEVAAGTAGLTSYLGPIGGGFMAGGLIGPMLANGNKAVGGLAGAASGAAAGALIGSIIPGIGTLIGALLGGASGGLGGLLGTQKPSVGKTASADVTINSDGKSATYGNIQTDNEGDPEAGKALGNALSTLFNTAVAGGGTLVKNFGIGQTAKDGYYVAGSVPYKKFGDDIAAMVRYVLLDQGGLKDGGANTIKAIQNTKAKDWDELSKDIALGASVDAGITALKEFDKTIDGVRKSAKSTTAESLKPMFEELERAKKLGFGGEYTKLAGDQFKSYLDSLKNPVEWTTYEQNMASLKGQFEALREAAVKLDPAIAATIDQIEAETKARLARDLNKTLDRSILEAGGRGYLNQISDLQTTLGVNMRDLVAVGEPAGKAITLFNTQLWSLLDQLTDDQLTDVIKTLGGDIGEAARKTLEQHKNNAEALRFEELIKQARIDNANETITALNDQVKAATDLQASWTKVRDSISKLKQDLLTGTLSTGSPEEKLRMAREAFDTLAEKAQNGDLEAADQLGDAAKTFLQASRDFNASNSDYVSDFNRVQSILGNTQTTAQRQVDLATKTLETLGTQLQTQKDILTKLQAPSATDVNSMISGMTSGNLGDIVQWAKRSGPDTLQKVLAAADEKLGWQNNPYRYSAPSDVANMDGTGFTADTALSWLRSKGYAGGWDNNANAFIQAHELGDQFTQFLRSYKADATEKTRIATKLNSLTNEQIEQYFGGYDDIKAARAANSNFNLAAWFQTYGKGEVLSGSRAVPNGFANGGVSYGAQLAWVSEGTYRAEAHVPLPDGRRIPVNIAGNNDNKAVIERLDRLVVLFERHLGVTAKAGDGTLQRMDAMIGVLEEQTSRQALRGAKVA